MNPRDRKIVTDIVTPYLLPGEVLLDAYQALTYKPAGTGGDPLPWVRIDRPSCLGSTDTRCIWRLEGSRQHCYLRSLCLPVTGKGWPARLAAEFLRLTGLDQRDPAEVAMRHREARAARRATRIVDLEIELAKLRAEVV